MFVPSLALTQQKVIPNESANFLPYQNVTFLDSARSHLFPAKNIETSELECQWICFSQFQTLAKDPLESIEQVRMMIRAPLQKVFDRFLNFYCPAVSQICNLILYSSTCIVFILKSTPIVEEYVGLKLLSQYRNSMLVLPTPLSPIITALTTQSQSCFFLGFMQFIKYRNRYKKLAICTPNQTVENYFSYKLNFAIRTIQNQAQMVSRGVQTPRLTHLQILTFFFQEPLKQVPIIFQLRRIQGSLESCSSFKTSIEGKSFWVSLMLNQKTFMKRSDAIANKQYDRPFIKAQEMSLIVFFYWIFGTFIFQRGLVMLRLKLIKATVLVFSYDYSYTQTLLLQIFIPFTTFFGEVQRFLQPTAIINSSSFTKFLLQDKQLSPNSFTCILYWNVHSLSLSGSGAVKTFKQPQLDAIARHNPCDLLGINLMSQMALFSWILCTDIHSYFYPSPLSIFFNSQIRI